MRIDALLRLTHPTLDFFGSIAPLPTDVLSEYAVRQLGPKLAVTLTPRRFMVSGTRLNRE